MSNQMVFNEIEALRKEMNDKYRLHAGITPEVLDLSVKLDQLLNKISVSSKKQT